MDNIKVYQPPGEVSQVEAFIEDLHPKLREKLVCQIFRLSRTPPTELKEPHYKHFSIEKYREFYELLSELSEDVRPIFLLHYGEGFSTKEVAQILDMNENTVKSKLMRGRKKLKQVLCC